MSQKDGIKYKTKENEEEKKKYEQLIRESHG